jgi:hypothetical protein
MAEFSEAKDSAFPQRIVLISLHSVITFTVWPTYEIDPYHGTPSLLVMPVGFVGAKEIPRRALIERAC